MLKFVTLPLFRFLLQLGRFQRWRDNLIRGSRLLGVPANDEKLWHQFKRDAKVFLKWRVKHFSQIRGIQIRTVAVRVRCRLIKPVRPVKKYLITLTDVPVSVESAQRCIRSAKLYGEDDNLEIFAAIDKHEARDFFTRHGLTQGRLLRSVNPLAAAGCFSSHYKLWLRCIELGEPIIVLEHDAVFRARIPPLRFKHVITLNVNWIGEFIYPAVVRRLRALKRFEGKEVFHFWPYMPGTCCYAVKPEGARRLIEAASRQFVTMADCFFCKENVDILYYHPAPTAPPDAGSSTIAIPDSQEEAALIPKNESAA